MQCFGRTWKVARTLFIFSLITAKSVAGVRVAGGSSLVFIDPSTLRRSTTATAAVAAAAASQEPVTMATTASCLARAFGIVVRQIADLLTMLQDYHALAPALPRTLDISYQESINLQVCINLFPQIFFA
jgi:E3 ubiquitin-protein ligase EDD1